MRRTALNIVALLAATSVASAQLGVGDKAPDFELEIWLNVAAEDTPTPASLAGKPLMIEFFGTWCEPCLRAMPHVQELHELYAEDGLVTIAISNEKPEPVRPYLAKAGLSFPVACDPDQRVHGSFGVGGWPTTILIDRKGIVRYRGSPWNVEPALLAVLGHRSGPGVLLDAVLDAARDGNEEAELRAMRRLMLGHPRHFDLAAWSKQRSKSGRERQAALVAPDGLPEGGFDLLSWARTKRARDYPLELAEARELIGAQRHVELFDAVVTRAPSAEAREAAAAAPDFVAWCAQESRASRELAKRGSMLEGWIFAGVEPSDPQRYWSELGVAGINADPRHGLEPGLTFGRERVTARTVAPFVTEALQRTIAARTYASGRGISPQAVERLVPSERKRILRALDARYGAPH